MHLLDHLRGVAEFAAQAQRELEAQVRATRRGVQEEVPARRGRAPVSDVERGEGLERLRPLAG